MSIYLIDSVAVNDRTDWRHQYLPGKPQSRREEQFPGIPTRYVVKGEALPPDLTIEGILTAEEEDVPAAIDALIDTLEQYNAMRADGATHTVTYREHDFADMELTDFVAYGDLLAIRAANDKIGRRVRFSWRALSVEGGA